MIRKVLLTFGLILTTSLYMFAQQGALQGKVIDKKTKEAIPFANIILVNKGTQVGGTTSDFNGNYQIKPIPPGKYDLKASYVGYKTVLIKGINIASDQIRFYNIEMTSTTETLKTVEVIDYKVPLISKDQTSSGASVTAEEVARMPRRNASAVATTVGGVFSADGERGSVRGARTNATAMYIDGIRVIGNASVPQSAIEQVDVVLGGTPAQYGDATSGVINVTTKGPSRQFGAGLELESSEYLDAFGHNRLGLNLMGPLIKGKNKNNTSLLGFFLAGDFNYNQDGAPSIVGHYYAKKDVLDYLKANPLRPSGGGSESTFPNAAFIGANDIVKTPDSKNTARYSINLLGNINVRTTKTIQLTMGGSVYAYQGRSFSYSGSMFNYEKNPLSKNRTYRGYVRFTQRFPTDAKSTSAFKNFYYTLQFDYTKTQGERGDANHWNDLFKYGYLGKFTTYKKATYQRDTAYVNGHHYSNIEVLNSWDFDTLTSWKPENYNPLIAEFTTNYYNLFAAQPDKYRNIDDIRLGGGLMNGDSPGSIYGLYQMAGVNQTGYSKSESDQYTLKFDGSLDIGKHAIKLGIQYEQRSSRGIGWATNGLWNLMRGLTNFHIKELDKANPIAINHDGQVDTVIYNRKYDAARQKVFDESMRKKLGLPVDGLDFIVIDSYDYDKGTIDYYDKNGKMHSVDVGQNLFDIGMFSPDELLNEGNSYVSYYGYDYKGNKLTGQPSFEDFFNNPERLVGAFQPIYMAGYIQDKFAFNDLIFNIGVRVDRFDANQKVLKDPYLLFPAKTVSEVKSLGGQSVTHPSTMGPNYIVYADNINNPSRIVGYRNGNIWYNAEGVEIQNPSIFDVGSGISPVLENPDQQRVDITSFKDYDPQINIMPRISFSFPISDEALFFAHYDVLTQRPTSNLFSNPATYYFFNTITGTINNPSLKPTKTIDYELGFTQKLTNTSSLSITSFYKEMRNMIQLYRFTGAYPKDYTSYSNLDFGTVKGLTVEYDLRRTHNVRLRASYTLQFADATGSSTTTAASLISAGLPNLRSTYPMPWDRRHQFNIVLDYRYGSGKKYDGPRINRDKKGKAPLDILANTGFNLTVTGGSGTPYTAAMYPLSPISGGNKLLRGTYGGSRLPWQFRMDFRADRDFLLKKTKNGKQYSVNVYLQVLNLLNTRNAINVYPYTGNPNDDGYLSAPEWQTEINNQLDPQAYIDMYSIYVDSPYNYSQPRQIRLGLMFNF